MAHKIKTIVFPTDFSDISVQALSWARDMAVRMDAEIHCLYVVEEPQIYSSLDMGTVAIPTSGELLASAGKRMERFTKEQLAGLPKGSKQKVVIGRPASEIVKYAREAGDAMIVMTTHGYSGVKRLLLGSTTTEVLRDADCPVLSVRAD